MAALPPRSAELASVDEAYDDAIRWYADQLSRPAEFPWHGTRFEPEKIGPTWQTTPDGHWLLPECTLGWHMLGFTGSRCQLKRGTPWRYTLEQARFCLWLQEVNEQGEFVNHDAVLQRLKGWGKDPFGATWMINAMIGPSRVAYMDGDAPVACDVPEAWVQTAATSLEQTKNTMRLFPGLLTPEAKEEFGIRIGKETIYALGDQRLIQAVTSSPATLEGARATDILLNETQHWLDNNDGHEMAAVIERNTTKSADGAARTLRITNAYEPSEDSVAQRDREAWELSRSGDSLTTGVMYDSLEAPPEAPLTAEDAPEVVASIRGDSVWLDVKRIVKSILDTRNPASRSRRFWYNQIVADEDAWTDPQWFGSLADKDRVIGPADRVVLFFDGSKNDDATALVGCRVEDGHVFVLGVWQRPPGARGKDWVVNRHAVDQRVREVFETHKVVAFFADPSHVLDDETTDRFWDATIDGWHQSFRHRLKLVWADGAPKSKTGHSIMWDMADPKRSAEFTAAAEQCAEEIRASAAGEAHERFTHDGDLRLIRHVKNARRYPNKWGVSLWKGHRESPKKIDLAVCMVGARMVRRKYLNADPKTRSRRVW